jgi:thiol-disulfide isomerase/thioredoxin
MPSIRLIPAVLAVLLIGCTNQPSPSGVPTAASAKARVRRPASAPNPDSPAAQAALLKDPKVPASLLVERGKKAMSAGNLGTASKFFDRAIEIEPTNRDALWNLGRITQGQAAAVPRPYSSPLFLRSAEVLRKLRDTYPKLTNDEKSVLPTVFFNEACTLALNGETARAFKSLGDALDAGFNHPEQLELDADLDSLRKFPEFQEIQKRAERTFASKVLAGSKPFPFDFRLPGLDGKPVALASFKGKVVLIDFWGTWCAPCRKETPHLVELARKYKEKGLEIVGLTYENENNEASRQGVASFIKEYEIPYTCLIGDEATKDLVPDFTGYPTTLFLDREGKVRAHLGGYHSQAAHEAFIEALLGEGKNQTAKK